MGCVALHMFYRKAMPETPETVELVLGRIHALVMDPVKGPEVFLLNFTKMRRLCNLVSAEQFNDYKAVCFLISKVPKVGNWSFLAA